MIDVYFYRINYIRLFFLNSFQSDDVVSKENKEIKSVSIEKQIIKRLFIIFVLNRLYAIDYLGLTVNLIIVNASHAFHPQIFVSL